MNHRGTQGPLTGIVVGRDSRTMEKDEQVFPMPAVPVLQPARAHATHPPLEHRLQPVLQLRHPPGIPRGRELWPPLPPMNGFAKERLQRQRPLQPRLVSESPLEVTELRRQTQLPLLGRGGELGPETITPPTRRALRPQHFGNDFRPATRPEEEIPAHRTPKPPLPPRPPGHARPGLVTANARTRRHLRANLLGERRRRRARPLQERACAPFADRHPKEVLTELRHALIAQMLRVFERAHRGREARPETPSAVQPRRSLTSGDRLTLHTPPPPAAARSPPAGSAGVRSVAAGGPPAARRHAGRPDTGYSSCPLPQ